MGDIASLGQINWQLFIALVLPGFISLRIYSLIHPSEARSLRDSFLEAISYSVMNGAVFWWAILWLTRETNPLIQYVLVVVVFFLAPVVWPFAIERALSWLEMRGAILRRAQTAWDDFFLRRQSCWVIIHLKDGRRIGGFYGLRSYATVYPQSGHLYLEELWKLNQETDEFQEKIPNSGGLIVRPEDYHLVEIKGIIDGDKGKVSNADSRSTITSSR